MIAQAARVLLVESEDLTRATVLRRPFDPPLVDEEDIGCLLRALSRHPRRHAITRVFAEGAESLAAQQTVFGSPPRAGERLGAWAKRVFPDRRFGVVAYKVEQLDDELTRRWAGLRAALAERCGVGQAGNEVFLFAGNYGYTPMGAHRDREQGPVIHLHAGPASKTITRWSDESYLAAHGSDTPCHDPAAIIASGESHRIDPGDVFVLPSGGYHVGHTPEMSASISLAEVLPTPRKVLDFVLAAAAEELATADALAPALMLQERRDPQDLQGLQGLQQLQGLLAMRPEGSAADWLETAYRSYQLSLLSNLGFSTPPALAHVAPDTLRGVRLKRLLPFPLPWERMAEDFVLYVRRRRLALPWDDAWPDIIAALEAPCPAEEMVARLATNWDEDAAWYVLALLVSHRGVEVLRG